MPTNVTMPQMGESIAEGTIVRWIKKVGDTVHKDEPLFEISTDKVDAEIPSPGAGVLQQITVNEGETVPVHSVVAVIAAADELSAAIAAPAGPGTPGPAADAPRVAPAVPAPVASSAAVAVPTAPAVPTLTDLRRTRSSPLVRKIAKEHGVDISRLTGTGISGRVTKHDILASIDNATKRSTETPARAPLIALAPKPSRPVSPSMFASGETVRVEKLSVMRRKIAEHMIASVRTSPHVYCTYEVDFGHIDRLRHARKAEFEAAGTKLTYTAFIAKATAEAIRQFPFANASIDGENVIYKRDINLGIAVALEQGLIVPVIKNARERDMLGLCRAIQDLAQRARTKQLKPEDVQDGTFTITNPGVFGAVFGMPIIAQPQVAILGVGSIERRVIAQDDMIAIRPTCYLTLGFDHRLIDGADAGRFLAALKELLQTFDESWM